MKSDFNAQTVMFNLQEKKYKIMDDTFNYDIFNMDRDQTQLKSILHELEKSNIIATFVSGILKFIQTILQYSSPSES